MDNSGRQPLCGDKFYNGLRQLVAIFDNDVGMTADQRQGNVMKKRANREPICQRTYRSRLKTGSQHPPENALEQSHMDSNLCENQPADGYY